MNQNGPLSLEYVECQCYDGCWCACGDNERVLRAFAYGNYHGPMSFEQREWCYEQANIDAYATRPKCEVMYDDELARTVLDSWHSYYVCNCI